MGKNIGKLVDTTINGAGHLVSKGVEKAGLPQVSDFVDETASIAMTGQAMQGVYQTAKGQLTKMKQELAYSQKTMIEPRMVR